MDGVGGCTRNRKGTCLGLAKRNPDAWRGRVGAVEGIILCATVNRSIISTFNNNSIKKLYDITPLICARFCGFGILKHM
jgi:hypothetical protein